MGTTRNWMPTALSAHRKFGYKLSRRRQVLLAAFGEGDNPCASNQGRPKAPLLSLPLNHKQTKKEGAYIEQPHRSNDLLVPSGTALTSNLLPLRKKHPHVYKAETERVPEKAARPIDGRTVGSIITEHPRRTLQQILLRHWWMGDPGGAGPGLFTKWVLI